MSELEKNPAAAAAATAASAAKNVMIGPTGSPLESSSPIPSPDYDAPSPQANEMELELPEDDLVAKSANDSLASRLDTMRDSLSKVVYFSIRILHLNSRACSRLPL